MIRRLLSCASAAVLCLSIAHGEEAFQQLRFDDALAAAKKDGKIVLIDFFTTWCGPCKKLDATTWKDEKVRAWLREKTVALKIDAERELVLARRYQVHSYPTILFLSADGLEITRAGGAVDAEEFVKGANYTLRTADPFKVASDAFAATPDDPTVRMSQALALFVQGKHAEALEHYLWSFDHGLANDAGFAGVRSTMLLDEIQRLGAVHPPAVTALTERAESFARRIVDGASDDQDLRDYLELSERLHGRDKALELFDRLAEKGAAAASVRKTLAGALTEALVERRRYADVVDSLPDLAAELAQQIARYGNRKTKLERSRQSTLGGAPALLEAFRARTLRTGELYYEASLGAGHADTAAKIADYLLALAPEAATYEKLVQRALRAKATDAAQDISKRAQSSALSADEKARVKSAATLPPDSH